MWLQRLVIGGIDVAFSSRESAGGAGMATAGRFNLKMTLVLHHAKQKTLEHHHLAQPQELFPLFACACFVSRCSTSTRLGGNSSLHNSIELREAGKGWPRWAGYMAQNYVRLGLPLPAAVTSKRKIRLTRHVCVSFFRHCSIALRLTIRSHCMAATPVRTFEHTRPE